MVIEVAWLRAWPSGHVHAFPTYPFGQRAALCGADPAEDTDTYPPMATACPRCWDLSRVSRLRDRPWLPALPSEDYTPLPNDAQECCS